MDNSPPGSSVHGISQARKLEWVAISFSRGSSWLRNQIWVSWKDINLFNFFLMLYFLRYFHIKTSIPVAWLLLKRAALQTTYSLREFSPPSFHHYLRLDLCSSYSWKAQALCSLSLSLFCVCDGGRIHLVLGAVFLRGTGYVPFP